MPGQRERLALVGTDFADFLLRMEIDPEGDLVPKPRRMTPWQRMLDWIAP